MGVLIRNEFVKIMHRKKTLVVFLAFVALVGIFIFANYKDVENRKKYDSPEFRIQNMEENLQRMKKDKEDPKTPEDYRKRLIEDIPREEEELKELKQEKEKGIKRDWKKEKQKAIEQLEKQRDTDNKLTEEDKKIINEGIKYHQYFLDNNIDPGNGHKVEAFSFLKQLFMILGMIFLGIGIAVFAADTVSGEYTPPTMKVLLTQPVSRGKVLLSKYIATVVSAIGLIVLVEFIAFIVVGLIFNFGNSMYPVQVGTRFKVDTMNLTNNGFGLTAIAGTTYIIPMWKFTLEMFLMQILYIVACTSFVFLASTVLKSSMVSISLSAVVIVALSIFQQMPGIRKIMPYVFVGHGNVGSILCGNIAEAFQNPILTPGFSMIVLVIWTVICYVISHVVFVKKDVLI